MKLNMGKADRLIRIILAIVLAVLFFDNIITGLVGAIGLAVAGILLLTSTFGICPLYALLGIKTRGPGTSDKP